jgi:putative ABC transport system permease protein
MITRKRPQAGTILTLAWLDLRHEWILTLCMVLAIAAVLAPLLILMGLKYGTIQTLRDRLVEDPVNREICPTQTERLSDDWFAGLAARPDVAFAIPTILRGSSIARVTAPSGKSLSIDLVPTAPGDPLILDNHGQIPKEGEVVLSRPAAEELKTTVGETLQLSVTRTVERQRESETLGVRVVAILDDRADALPRLYAPQRLVEDIETYREGLGVPERQWPGGQSRPFASFDGVRVVTPVPLDNLTLRGLAIGTGLVDVEGLDGAVFAQRLGFPLPAGAAAYELRARGNSVQVATLRQLKGKLRGRQAILLPYADGVILTLEGGSSPLAIVGLSLTTEEAATLEVAAPPWGGLDTALADARLRQILLPEPLPTEQTLTLETTLLDGKRLDVPVHLAGAASGARAIVPAELLGVLRTGLERRLEYDPARGGLVLAKVGHRGFRLYARGIDDVPVLYRWFVDQGISVQTMAQEIERVQILDRGLTRIFWLVAAVGILGGMASLVANLYAAVERKKRDISVLRLMGLARRQVFRFPLYQGLTMAGLSVLLASGGYALFEAIINQLFAADLRLGQKICTLPVHYFGMALLITTGIALLSSLLAAWKTTQIDPAEALREE